MMMCGGSHPFLIILQTFASALVECLLIRTYDDATTTLYVDHKKKKEEERIIINKYVINRPSRAWMYVVRQHTYYTQDNNYSTYKLPISQC